MKCEICGQHIAGFAKPIEQVEHLLSFKHRAAFKARTEGQK
jgi:ribosome-binding protein aMBF1 (putative translation factor)